MMGCAHLPIIENGNLILPDTTKGPPFSIGQKIHIHCNENYHHPTFRDFFECLPDGTWSETDCFRNLSCPDPGYVEHAQRIGVYFNFPHSVTFVCEEGYKMTGLATQYCMSTGVWQPTRTAKCIPVTCPELKNPANGEVVYLSSAPFNYGSVVRYRCQFSSSLINERKCQSDGTWSGKEPICPKIFCKKPGPFSLGRVIGNDKEEYEPGDILVSVCHGDPSIHTTMKCLKNGLWSSSLANCPDNDDSGKNKLDPGPRSTIQNNFNNNYRGTNISDHDIIENPIQSFWRRNLLSITALGLIICVCILIFITY